MADVGSARVAVLFSGGLDSMVVAALAHEFLPLEEPVDLVNVCFDSPGHQSPDRLAAWAGLEELNRCCPGRVWRLVCVDVIPDELEAHRGQIEHLMQVRHVRDSHGYPLRPACRDDAHLSLPWCCLPYGSHVTPPWTLASPRPCGLRHAGSARWPPHPLSPPPEPRSPRR